MSAFLGPVAGVAAVVAFIVVWNWRHIAAWVRDEAEVPSDLDVDAAVRRERRRWCHCGLPVAWHTDAEARACARSEREDVA